MSARRSVAIVGGGVIGLACAFELARRGYDATVLERNLPGSGASNVAAGMLGPTSESERSDPELVAFQLDSLRRYPDFVAAVETASGLSCGYRAEGTLWVSRHRDDELELDHLYAIQTDRGLSAKRLSARETRQLEPYVTPRAVGGLFVADDHQVDPRRLAPALVRACERGGVQILTGETVAAVRRRDGSVQISLDGGESINADLAILAAGAWIEHGLSTPAPRLGMRPIKGQLLRLRGEPLVDRVIRTPDIYIVPRADGELIIGATEEEQGWDDSVSAGGTLDLLRYAWEVLPGLYDLALDEISVGFRPAVRDHRPAIGAAETDGIYVAAAHYRHGILLAPATAHWLAEQIDGGSVPDAIAPFGLGRFTAATGAAS